MNIDGSEIQFHCILTIRKQRAQHEHSRILFRVATSFGYVDPIFKWNGPIVTVEVVVMNLDAHILSVKIIF